MTFQDTNFQLYFYFMFQKQGLQGSFRPIIHSIGQQLHRYGIYSEKISYKYNLKAKIVTNGQFEKLYNIHIIYIITLSIFSLTAHIRAIEPILFVIVTRVARARSSFVTVFLRSLEFICPKLRTVKKQDINKNQNKEITY